MRILLAVACGVSSAGALSGMKDKLPPEAYVDPVDQEIARTGKGIPGRPGPCIYEQFDRNGKVAWIEGRPPLDCVKFEEHRKWRGLWRHGMEASLFCPEPAKTCHGKTASERIWLSRTPGGGGSGQLYRVEFMGRKTAYKGPYGHAGMYDHEIVIDRVISIQMLDDPMARLERKK